MPNIRCVVISEVSDEKSSNISSIRSNDQHTKAKNIHVLCNRWDSVSVVVGLIVFRALKVLHHHVLKDHNVVDLVDVEDNVGVDLIIPGSYKTFSLSRLGAKGSHAGQGDGVVVFAEGVEDPLVPAISLGDHDDFDDHGEYDDHDDQDNHVPAFGLRDDPDLRAEEVNASILKKVHRCFQTPLA